MLDGGNIGGNVGQGGYGQTSGGDPLGFGYDAYGNPMGTDMSNEVSLDIVRAMWAAMGKGQPGYMNPYGQTVGTPPTGTNLPGWGVVDMGPMKSSPALKGVDLIEQGTVDPWGSALLNSESNMGVPTDANPMGGDIDGGSDPRRKPWWSNPDFWSSGYHGDFSNPLVRNPMRPPGLVANPGMPRPLDPSRPKDFPMHGTPSDSWRLSQPPTEGPSGGGPNPWTGILGAVAPYIRKKRPLAYENAYQNVGTNEGGGWV